MSGERSLLQLTSLCLQTKCSRRQRRTPKPSHGSHQLRSASATLPRPQYRQRSLGPSPRLTPQHTLTTQAASIGHSVSKRRPIDLTTEQAASINTDPRIRRLPRQLRGLTPRSQEYRADRSKMQNERQRLRRELKQTIRNEWTAN